ncbi:hypothetical protein HMPREF2719_21600 [Pseudomonas aeruginosa]|nr:hypothetical protein HMPREF2719_21600 [Pseudomonas aeruginosa]
MIKRSYGFRSTGWLGRKLLLECLHDTTDEASFECRVEGQFSRNAGFIWVFQTELYDRRLPFECGETLAELLNDAVLVARFWRQQPGFWNGTYLDSH